MNMKLNVLENANVFCISSSGVVKSNHFLTLVTCRGSKSNDTSKRQRTLSLPSSFDEKPKRVYGLKIPARCLSEDMSTFASAAGCRNVCIKCISNMMKLRDKNGSSWEGSICGVIRKRKHSNFKKGDMNRGSINATHYHRSNNRLESKTDGQSTILKTRRFGDRFLGAALQMDGYLLSYFMSEVTRSQAFRNSFIRRWSEQTKQPLLVFVVIMKAPDSEVLDMLGNKMVNSNIWFRRSLEHALSWLSTLGGAFSALGDLSPSYAEEAGHVSLTQLRIALKLNDPGIQSRCRLYAAISLLQRGYLKSCRDIVRSEYKYAVSLPEDADPRLRRMCLGVWAKLQYHWKLATMTDRKMLKSTLDGLKDIRSNTKYRNVYDLEEGRKIVTPENMHAK